MAPAAAVVIPSLSGGWIEIGRPVHSALLELWRQKYGYEPAVEIGRGLEPTDLVSTVAAHAADGAVLLSPLVWPGETQRRFAHFFAFLARMTYTFPQQAAFSDGKRFSIDAEVYREPSTRRPAVHVRCEARVTSALRDSTCTTALVLDRAAFASVVGSCCAVFPALGEADLHAAWN